MSNTDRYLKNLAALREGDPNLARRIDSAVSEPALIETRTSSGLPSLAFKSGDRPVHLHSRYDPVKEAKRLLTATDGARFIVAVGMGAGFHLLVALEAGMSCLVVEPEPAFLKVGLGLVDLSKELRNGTVKLVCSKATEEITAAIGAAFISGLDRRLAIMELPGRFFVFPEAMRRLRSVIEQATRSIAGDAAIQARHGIRWVRNTLLNLVTLADSPAVQLGSAHDSEIVVAAAGPSLDRYTAASHPQHEFLIAVDSAVRPLWPGRHRPDIVISIDCQPQTYHHFLGAGRADLLVACDLSLSASVMTTLTHRYPLLSRLPFHQLLRLLGVPFPFADVTGGNVTHAAVDFATRLAPREIRVLGADFSYPNGTSYARSSYIHDFFLSRSNRLCPSETQHFALLVERPGAARDKSRSSRWILPEFLSFAYALSGLISGSPVPVHRIQDLGIPLPESAPSVPTRHAAFPGRSTALEISRVRAILHTIRDLIAPIGTEDDLRKAVNADQPLLRATGYALLAPLAALATRSPELTSDQRVGETSALLIRFIDQALQRTSGRSGRSRSNAIEA